MRVPRNHLRESVGNCRGAGVAGSARLLAALLLLAASASAQAQVPAGDQGSSKAAGESPGPEAQPELVPEAAEPSTSDAGEKPKTEAAEPSSREPDEAPESTPSRRVPLPSPKIEEIEVVGRRMKIVVPDPTVSAVGFDPAQLKAEGIDDIRDLSNFTPSLEIKSAFAASNPTIFIRGVGLDDFNANAAQAVAIYQDGVYMQSPAGQLFQFFDSQSVEVLRGPQGTLFRSASAGAILVRSREPTEDVDGYLESTYGRFNEVDVEGAIGGPLVPGLLSGRLSGTWGIRDGITKNRCANKAPLFTPCNQTTGGGPGIPPMPVVEPGINTYTNDINAYAARGQLLFEVPLEDSEMDWLVNAHGGQNFSRAFQYQQRGVRFERPVDVPGCDDPSTNPLCFFVPQPLEPPRVDASNYRDTDGDPFMGDYNIDGPEDLSLWGINLRGTWRFGDGYELDSLTAYEWHDRFIQENTDANPNFLLETLYGDTAWQVSQQFDLRGNWSESEVGDGRWHIGLFWLQEDLNVDNFFDVTQGSKLSQIYEQKTRNFAPYAWSEYRIQPGCESISCDFTLITGLRYNLEYKRFDIDVCGLQGTSCQTSLAGVEDDLWDGLSGEVSLAWNFSELRDFYLKYSRGWKGGHFNGGAVSPFDVITGVDPEIVNSYEAGLRSYWFDRRLMLNLTGFYYDYQDLQVFIIEQTPSGFPISKLVNASDATVYGVEVDLGAEPLPGLVLTYNFAWVESEYKDFVVSFPFTVRANTRPGQVPRPPIRLRLDFDYSGNPLIASPRFSMTGSAAYTIPLPIVSGWALGSLTPRFSFSWKDDVFYDGSGGKGQLVNFPEGTFGQPAFWVLNASLGWRSENERFEVLGWVHNMLDEYYKTQSFDLSRGFNLILDAYAVPRTYGVTATISF